MSANKLYDLSRPPYTRTSENEGASTNTTQAPTLAKPPSSRATNHPPYPNRNGQSNAPTSHTTPPYRPHRPDHHSCPHHSGLHTLPMCAMTPLERFVAATPSEQPVTFILQCPGAMQLARACTCGIVGASQARR